MAYRLTIDQGNTAAKLALWEGDTLADIDIVSSLTPAHLDKFVGRDRLVVSAIYCSVAQKGQHIVDHLHTFVPKVLTMPPTPRLPIKIDYGTPGTLGADRVAAAVGAHASFAGEPLLVIDAGTAITYDHVDADGRFAGGNIAPGMTMRLQALHRFTARLPRLEMPHEIPYAKDLIFGHDTASAMILGAVHGITGAIRFYRSKLPFDTRIVMTGGWAQELARRLDFDVTVDRDLVSKGLNRILLYNEPYL